MPLCGIDKKLVMSVPEAFSIVMRHFLPPLVRNFTWPWMVLLGHKVSCHLDCYSINLLVLALQLGVHVDRHVPQVRQDSAHLI